MNIAYDFTQTGGFPLGQGVLNDFQNAILDAASIVALAGPLAIISGCAITGTNVDNGVVVINGEILPFVGGTLQSNVIIKQTTDGLLYYDGNTRQSKITRYATFGNDGIQNNPWASFKKNTTEGVLSRLERLEMMAAPFIAGGGMVLWNKAANLIPTGWREVVDWRGRLPMGYDPNDPDFNTVGNGNGSKTHTLGYNELPPLKAGVGDNIAGTTTGAGKISFTSGGGQDLSLDVTGPNGEALGGSPFNILNPYRIVVFIEPIPQN